jgi:SOS-response transcriptional repressor LexA
MNHRRPDDQGRAAATSPSATGDRVPRVLTPRRQAVLDAVRTLTARDGYPPTVREIGAAVGLASPSSVHVHLRALEQHGLLASSPYRPRARLVVEGGRSFGPDDHRGSALGTGTEMSHPGGWVDATTVRGDA